MLKFPVDYFEEEEREGFLVEADMKHTWAAQLEVIKHIERICEKYGLKYYAFYGTLLGAVRHNGYIPWDDDVDIAMIREDYEEFLSVAQNELPEQYIILNPRIEPEWEHLHSRVVNSHSINYSKDYLIEYHGCPYVIGIDVFPLDHMPEDEETKNSMDELLHQTYSLLPMCWADPKYRHNDEKLEKGLKTLEKTYDFKFDRNGNLFNQILCLFDIIASSYGNTNSELITNYWNYEAHGKRSVFHKQWLSDTIGLGFECDTINAPIGVEAVLVMCYGNKFMTPVKNSAGHDYPFYKEQKQILIEHGKYEAVTDIRKFIKDVSCAEDVQLVSEEDKEGIPQNLADALSRLDNGKRKKKIIFYPLNSACILTNRGAVIDKLLRSVEIFEASKENIAIILAEDITFHETLEALCPSLVSKYISIKQYIADNGIGVIGDSIYYDYAGICDAYYGDATSVIGDFIKVKKPIMIQNYDI